MFPPAFDCPSFLISHRLPRIFTCSYLSLPLSGSSTFSVSFLLYHGSVFYSVIPICAFTYDVSLASCNTLLQHFISVIVAIICSIRSRCPGGRWEVKGVWLFFFFCSRNKTSPLLKPDTLSPNLPIISALKMNHPLPKFHCTHISEGNSAQMRWKH